MVPAWFLYLSGFSLVVLGILQIQTRPRRKGANLFERFVNVGTLWSLLCIAAGSLIVAIALGYVTPFDKEPPPRAVKHRFR